MAIATLPSTPFMMDNPIFDVGQFQNMLQVAEIMAKAKLVPDHLQGKPADCFLVVEQARRWNMSPFAVAQETYAVKGKLLFGGKLVAAVINSRAPVKSPLRFTFKGEGDKCEVTVSATLKGDDEPRSYSITVGEAKAVAGNSSLWKTDPKQQVCYFAARFWARRHCPETLLGVWAEDEFCDSPPMRDVNPRPARQPDNGYVELTDQHGQVFIVDPDNVIAWARERATECASDEELSELAAGNSSHLAVVLAASEEREKRANGHKDAAAEDGVVVQPKADRGPPDFVEYERAPLHSSYQDGPDPLHLNGLSAKDAIGLLQSRIDQVDALESDRLLALYRDKLQKAAPNAYKALEGMVAAKIEGKA